MSIHWLYQIKEVRDQETRRQQYFNQHFAIWAETFWEQLCQTIQADFETMKKLFPDLLSQETYMNRESRSLRWDYVDRLPQYHLRVTVNIPEQTLTLHRTVVSPPERPKSLSPLGPETVLTLSLNGEDQKIELVLDETVLSPEEFSQRCLRPIFDLYPIEIAKIRGSHGKQGPSVRSF